MAASFFTDIIVENMYSDRGDGGLVIRKRRIIASDPKSTIDITTISTLSLWSFQGLSCILNLQLRRLNRAFDVGELKIHEIEELE